VEDEDCPSKPGKACEDTYKMKYSPTSVGGITGGFVKKKNAIGVSENLELNKCDSDEEKCISSTGLLVYSSDCTEE
jgi:hypothetical protein